MVNNILRTFESNPTGLDFMVRPYEKADQRPVKEAVVKTIQRIFPKTQENERIHFISANLALHVVLRGGDEGMPEEFRVMRDRLLTILKTDQQSHMVEKPLELVEVKAKAIQTFLKNNVWTAS